MNEDCVCEGILKQQNVDSSGMYVWEAKYFRLHVADAVLEAYDNEERAQSGDMSSCTQMTIVGAKHAKEWSLSTPSIGSYGFDVVWSSGRIWSFLAEDEYTCRQWVENINQTISLNPLRETYAGKNTEDDRAWKLDRTGQNTVEEADDTYIEESSPPQRRLVNAQPTVSKYNRPNADISQRIGLDTVAPPPPSLKTEPAPIDRSFNMSSIPLMPSRSPSDISPESGDGSSHKQDTNASRRAEERDSMLRHVAPFDMSRETEREGHPLRTEDVQSQLSSLMRR